MLGDTSQAKAKKPQMVSVDADALREVLQALIGPAHHIRELQATRSLHTLGYPNAIDTLLESFNEAVTAKKGQA